MVRVANLRKQYYNGNSTVYAIMKLPATICWKTALPSSQQVPGVAPCHAGLLRVPSGAKWNYTKTHEEYSIIPGFPGGPKEPPFTTRLAEPRPSEVELYLDIRPPVPPSSRSRVCLRSTQVLKSACGAGASKPGSSNMAVAAQPTDPESPLFSVGRLAAPLGPCLETSADGKRAEAALNPHMFLSRISMWLLYTACPRASRWLKSQ